MNVIAMYLPQFHRVKENDEWWGEGFTEWTTVKGADKLFSGHYQPRVPQDQNYYNLLEKDTMLWQAELMKKYNIDGVCMYHYWFKDGKQILEKPAENLLEWQDIEMPFCFCWANQTWARSWSKIQNANVWSDIYEQAGNTQVKGVLLEQKYGNEQQWKQHFDYLVPFFRDKRYIRIDDKPLFLIYRAVDIPCLLEMIEFWRKLAIEYGFNGIYVIGSGCKEMERKGLDAELLGEPAGEMGNLNISSAYVEGIRAWEYDDFWNGILAQEKRGKVYFEGVVGFDDTPRRGKNGKVILNATPDKFEYYLTELMAKSAAYQNEIVFLNAWNEWGEGMYLEPDEKYEDKFLQAVLNAKNKYMLEIDKYVKRKNSVEYKLREAKDIHISQDKNSHYLRLLDDWMSFREKGVRIANKLLSAGYKSIAIYGYGIAGRHLFNELITSKVLVKCIIDQKKDRSHIDGINLYYPTEEIPDVDAIIVSATYYYDEIYEMLKNKVTCRIISLETLLYEDNLI